ncbi:type II toxin-antitoxin system Phd/YefM family antitoxin [Candidatus Woesearchaeota archaeon]|nr:type II toxin-antitoxin system Phd/YefM family antitoxin [Candidatus Woesearchaeota archaeon]
MNTKTTLPISEARKEIFKIADKVQKTSNYYTLTEKGKPKAVILSAKDFESWQETLEVIKDFPNLEKDIEKSEREYKKGDYLTLEEILAKQGFIISNKSKKNVSDSSRKKSRKRFK